MPRSSKSNCDPRLNSHGSRDHHLTRLRVLEDTGGDVDGDASELAAELLHFADVDTGADLDAQRLDGRDDVERAANRIVWLAEAGEKPIPGGIDLAPTVRLELLAHDAVVLGDQLGKTAVTQRGGMLGRRDNVRKEDSRKRASRSSRALEAHRPAL